MIETVAATGSTNADLAARLGAGEALGEGFWLIADRQRAGRGRQGRVWEDGFGNFMGSTLVRRMGGDPPAPSLSLAAGDLDKAVAGLLINGDVATDVNGDGVLAGFTRIAAFRAGLSGDQDACYQHYT